MGFFSSIRNLFRDEVKEGAPAQESMVAQEEQQGEQQDEQQAEATPSSRTPSPEKVAPVIPSPAQEIPEPESPVEPVAEPETAEEETLSLKAPLETPLADSPKPSAPPAWQSPPAPPAPSAPSIPTEQLKQTAEPVLDPDDFSPAREAAPPQATAMRPEDDSVMPAPPLPEQPAPHPDPEQPSPAQPDSPQPVPLQSSPSQPSPAQPIPPQPKEMAAPGMDSEETAMALALREAEPKLSAWLEVVLVGVERADDLLWDRVRFLLRSLEAQETEIEAFVSTFRHWLEDMEYEDITEFRSELQYRLALALDLEDEEDERSRLILKLTEGLAKTREQITRNLNNLFRAGRAIDEELWEELEEVLIMADVGYETAHALTQGLRRRAATGGYTDASSLREAMRLELLDVFKPVRRISVVNPPEVALVMGVNGVGKTTTIAKLCHRAVLQGKKVLLVAGDTFRAAATEQLEIWAKRAGAGFYAKGHGADPAAVSYEAIDKAVSENYDTVFVDTAGRLHTKTNLMEELTKISRVLGKRHPGAPHRTILVLDATTGQNALSQVKLFNQACAIDELVLTKLDGTAKGGIAVAVAMQYGIPISFVGLGEKMDDLRPFDAESYVTALLGLEKTEA